MRVVRIYVALWLLSIAASSFASEFGLSPASQNLPQASPVRPSQQLALTNQTEVTPVLAGCGPNYLVVDGFFAGVGGSYNSVRVNQNLFASGTTNLTINNVLVATGSASGPAAPFELTQTTFAPVAQVGFFRNFSDSSWQWGTKFSYKYLGLNFTDSDVVAPQSGAITPTANAAPGDTFTGHEIQQSVQTSVNSQLSGFLLLAHSFNHGQVYFGGGPVAFQTQANIYQAIGFANLNGTPSDITGTPVEFSNSQWMWGGGTQFGLIYYFAPTWYLDFSYDFIFTGNYTINDTSPFTSQSGVLTDNGVLSITTTRRIFAQSIGFMVCKVF